MDLRSIELDRDSSLSLAEQLFEALRQRILSQQLPTGSRLPASRRLAEDLSVSRNTVNNAFEQLKAQGYLQSRTGSGVFVSDQLPQKDQSLEQLNRDNSSAASFESSLEVSGVNSHKWPEISDYGQKLLAFGQEHQPNQINGNLPFTLGLPDVRKFPIKTWQQLLRRHSDRKVLMGYHGYQGYLPLRQALAIYLNSHRGLRCHSEQIIITQGAQQALALAAQILINPGQKALVEEPGYCGARKAFASNGAELCPVPLADTGLDIQALEKTEFDSASLLYCTPTHQYPLGGILSAAQRLQLLHWAQRNSCWILEDDYDSEFHYFSKPVAAMAGMAAQTPVIYMGSFSKTLLPGIRLGYLVVPKHLVGAFVEAKAFSSGETPLLIQAAAADFISEGHFVRHLRKMRKLYQDKWLHMQSLCEQYLQGLMEPIAQSAGMHIALEFTPELKQNLKDKGVDDRELNRQLEVKGFGSSPLSSYYHGHPDKTGLALGFANTNEQEREEGILTLRGLILAMSPHMSPHMSQQES